MPNDLLQSMTNTPTQPTDSQEPPGLQPTDTPDKPEGDEQDDKIARHFLNQVTAAKQNKRDNFIQTWQTNVQTRLGVAMGYVTDGVDTEDGLRSELNPDWSLTKTKTANLYSQTPQVQVTFESKEFASAVYPFAKALNYEIGEKRCNTGAAIEEVMNDVVNAAGVGVIRVGWAARFVTKKTTDKNIKHLPKAMQALAIKMGIVKEVEVPVMTDSRFFTGRVSPANYLWPVEFIGSNFDDSDWQGHSGDLSWSEAKSEFKLSDDDKAKVLSGDGPKPDEELRYRPEQAHRHSRKRVYFDEIFYWRYRVDPEEPFFSTIWRIVYVTGLDKPVIHEAWKGQRLKADNSGYVGAQKFPIRVLTLTYITDNPIPPSDTEAGRAQVEDLRRSRAQMFMNRQFSIPMRWYDVNRTDPLVMRAIQNGEWQSMVPTNGDGTKSLGEISRASYPAEDLTFDRQTMADLFQTWQISQSQMGIMAPGERTKAEVSYTQQNFQTRMGQERQRAASFFLGVVEVLAGFMALYSDFPNLNAAEKAALNQVWNRGEILHDIVFKIHPDSTVMLDAKQRMDRAVALLNIIAKSGVVDIMPIVADIVELGGYDPSQIVKPPVPRQPDEPSISYRFSGKEDVYNPVVLAMLIEHGEAPSLESLAAAKKMLADAQMPPSPAMAMNPAQQPGQPGQQALPGQAPLPQHAALDGNAHPNFQIASKVAQRSEDARPTGV